MWSILQIKGWLHIICTYLSVERKTTPTFPQWAFPHIPVCIFFPLRSPAQGYLHCRSAGSAGQGQFCLTTSFWPAEGSYTPSLGYECLRFSTLSRRASAFCALSLAVFIGFLFPRLPPSLSHLWLLVQPVTCLHALVHVLSNIQIKMKTIHF